MENLPARVPHTLFPDLISSFVPPDIPPDAVLELVITVDDHNIPTREFAEYLELIDRLYGRLSREGLMSYAHRESGRLRIAEIRRGSVEIIFQFLHEYATPIIIRIFLGFYRKHLSFQLTLTRPTKRVG